MTDRGRMMRRGATYFATLAGAMLCACATGMGPSAPAFKVGAREPLPFALDAYASTYRPLPRRDTLIRHATVLDGVGHRYADTDVLLADGKVAAIGAGLRPPPGAVVVEGAGEWLTPGIIDVHSHDGDFASPYVSPDLQHSDVNEISDPNTAQVWAEHSITVQDPGFSRALAGGVTTLQILPGSSNLFGGRSVVLKNIPATTVQAMKFPEAMQGLKMACGENPKYTYGDKGRFPSSRMGNVAGDRDGWVKAQAYERKWLAYERGEAAQAPERDLRLDTLAGVLHGDLLVHMHCYRADDMATMLDTAHEFGFRITAFHHAVEAYKIPELFLRDDVCAVVWSDWWGYKMEALDAIRENAAFLDAAGACVTMHSDSSTVGQRLTIEAAKAMAAGRRAGLSIAPERAIRWVTSNPARALGLQAQIGSLQVGKNADAVLWSGDPFSIYSHARQVYVDGARVYDRDDPSRRPVSDFELGMPAAGPAS